MKKDDIYKEFMTDFVRGLIAGNYNVRDFCNDYSAMERRIYNDAKKTASHFVDNFDENIKNFIENKQKEEDFKQKQQEQITKIAREFFDDCVKALSKEPLISKIIVLDDLLKRIQEGAYLRTPTYYNKGKDPTFHKNGIKTDLEDGIYYKGVKVGDF